MLKLVIPDTEFYDSGKEEFVYLKRREISLEHSLVSVSKWESKFKRSFLNDGPKTTSEIIEYVKCMTITQNVDPLVYRCLNVEALEAIKKYIAAPMTATTFSNQGRSPSREIITSELIYYWMVALQIPSEYEKWHLNRLLTLIQVCNSYNQPPKKMSKSDIIRNNDALNAARRAAMRTRG